VLAHSTGQAPCKLRPQSTAREGDDRRYFCQTVMLVADFTGGSRMDDGR